MDIINLTQHTTSSLHQKALGVRDLPLVADREALKGLLTFTVAPTADEIRVRAVSIAKLAAESGCSFAMIGGAGYLMPALEKALLDVDITPLHAFTVRDVVETTSLDGTVTKTAVFKHAGWVTNYPFRRVSVTAEDSDGYEYQGSRTYNVLDEREDHAINGIFVQDLWITSIRSKPVY